MTYQTFLTLCLSLIVQTAWTQTTQLLEDKNIPWVASFSYEYRFDMQEEQYGENNGVLLTKFLMDPNEYPFHTPKFWLRHHLINNAEEGAYKCYADSAMTMPLSPGEVMGLMAFLDTILTINPQTYEEQIQIVRNEIKLEDLQGIHTRQILYFDQKSNCFNTKLVSIAPMFKAFDAPDAKPLFWIKMDQAFPDDYDVHQPEISFAALTRINAPFVQLQNLKVLKDEIGQPFPLVLYNQAVQQLRPIDSNEEGGYGRAFPLSRMEIEEKYNRVDTILTFDPLTYEETIRISGYEIKPESIDKFRFIQEWHYNDKTRQLHQRLLAIAPVYAMRDDNGNFKYYQPLYYIRYD